MLLLSLFQTAEVSQGINFISINLIVHFNGRVNERFMNEFSFIPANKSDSGEFVRYQ